MTKSIFPGIGFVLVFPAAAMAAHWNVDYARSKLDFSVLWSNEPFSARFKTWEADIDFDPAAPQKAHVDVMVDLASEASDEPDFDDGLKGAQGFQVSRFPAARFVAAGFVHKQADEYVANGTLTLKGVTRQITLPFRLELSGAMAHMIGTAKVLRTDFGVGLGPWAAAQPVARDVSVSIDLTASR